jgi:NAD+ diphosphatase
VVIMVVASGDRLLLGRHAGWPPRRYSVLAGYVAPGETLEEAVAREVREESGVEALDPRYVASQPWPFPSSLMLGFEAGAHGGEPTARDGELENVRWFPLEQVAAGMREQNAELELPGRVSIAGRLIERWVAQTEPE